MYTMDLERVDRRVAAQIPGVMAGMAAGATGKDGEPLQLPSFEAERAAYWTRLCAPPPTRPAEDTEEQTLRRALGLGG